MSGFIPKAKLSHITEKIAYHEGELARLYETYDREFAQDVRANNRLEAGLTIPQIRHLVALSEGTLRNRMSREPLRDRVIKVQGKSGLRFEDVKKHLLSRSRGRISQDRVSAILHLRNTTDMTQEKIAETLNLSRKTIQRVLDRDATSTKTEE